MSMFPIASATSGSAFSYGTFTSIPQTFTHLQLRVFGRATFNNGGYNGSLYIQFNGSGANYGYRHSLSGNGSTATSFNGTSTSQLALISLVTDAGSIANNYGVSVIDILDYTNTNKNKTVRAIGGADNNGTANYGAIALTSQAWLDLSAISSIQVGTDAQFAANSRIDLYGISTSNATGA